jgi:hypothetical protein
MFQALERIVLAHWVPRVKKNTREHMEKVKIRVVQVLLVLGISPSNLKFFQEVIKIKKTRKCLRSFSSLILRI